MTDHSERDEAAEKYTISVNGQFSVKADWNVATDFIAGADWAVKNDPRVLKLVEALKFYAHEPRWIPRHHALTGLNPEADIEGENGEKARTALTEWSKP